MLIISDQVFGALEGAAQQHELMMVADRLIGAQSDRIDAARQAVSIARAHDLDAMDEFVTLAEIMLRHGPNAASSIPWLHEILTSKGGRRSSRLCECWAIARTLTEPSG